MEIAVRGADAGVAYAVAHQGHGRATVKGVGNMGVTEPVRAHVALEACLPGGLVDNPPDRVRFEMVAASGRPEDRRIHVAAVA